MKQPPFSALFELREQDAQRFAKLLHDDAGQMLTAIALRLSALEVPPEARVEIQELQSYLDELLDRFRLAQSSLGSAVIPRRGLAAALSHWRRLRGDMQIQGVDWPVWPVSTATACYRIVEHLQPSLIEVNSSEVLLYPRRESDDYVAALAAYGDLTLEASTSPRTIKIIHADSHPRR
jgi:hypothetical protein